jgi:hypothetical protein
LFGIGDSFLDTGNRDPTNNTLLPSDIIVNQDWTYPYGISLGAPVGRYSDGLLFFDFLGKENVGTIILLYSQTTLEENRSVVEGRVILSNEGLENWCVRA